MNEKYLTELKEIEERLYDLVYLCGEELLNSKLADAWSNLFDYLIEKGIYEVPTDVIMIIDVNEIEL